MVSHSFLATDTELFRLAAFRAIEAVVSSDLGATQADAVVVNVGSATSATNAGVIE
jgi:hypothetical protein